MPCVLALLVSAGLNAVNEVNSYLRTLGGEGVVILDTEPILTGERGIVRRAYSHDLLHLTELGYQALNEALVPALEAWIP